MRIISGKRKGFRFPEKDLPHVRPTTDRSKESLFNILALQCDFEHLSILDLYSGTGSITFEFWSRGCTNITAVDNNYKSIKYIQDIDKQLEADIQIRKSAVIPFLKQSHLQYDLVFADPPYLSNEFELLIQTVDQYKILKQGGMLIIEHPSTRQFTSVGLKDQRKYGQSMFSFYTFD